MQRRCVECEAAARPPAQGCSAIGWVQAIAAALARGRGPTRHTESSPKVSQVWAGTQGLNGPRAAALLIRMSTASSKHRCVSGRSAQASYQPAASLPLEPAAGTNLDVPAVKITWRQICGRNLSQPCYPGSDSRAAHRSSSSRPNSRAGARLSCSPSPPWTLL